MKTEFNHKDSPLVAGQITSSGNFKLKKKIETFNELLEVMNTKKSVFARHRMYPTAFLQGWPLRTISIWMKNGWFWTAEPFE